MADHSRNGGRGNRYLRSGSSRGNPDGGYTSRHAPVARGTSTRSHTPEFWPDFESLKAEQVPQELRLLANRIRAGGNDLHKMQFCLHELPQVLYKLAGRLEQS